jgi:histidine kinase
VERGVRAVQGYRIVSTLHESVRSVVLRAQRHDGTPVMLKLLNLEHPTPEQSAAFSREYQLATEAFSPGVVKMHGLERQGNSLLMLMADPG